MKYNTLFQDKSVSNIEISVFNILSRSMKKKLKWNTSGGDKNKMIKVP